MQHNNFTFYRSCYDALQCMETQRAEQCSKRSHQANINENHPRHKISHVMKKR